MHVNVLFRSICENATSYQIIYVIKLEDKQTGEKIITITPIEWWRKE